MLVEESGRHRSRLSLLSHLPPGLSVQQPGIGRSGPHAVLHALCYCPAVPRLEQAGDHPAKLLLCSGKSEFHRVFFDSLKAFLPSGD